MAGVGRELLTGETIWAQLNRNPFAYLLAYGIVVGASLINRCDFPPCPPIFPPHPTSQEVRASFWKRASISPPTPGVRGWGQGGGRLSSPSPLFLLLEAGCFSPRSRAREIFQVGKGGPPGVFSDCPPLMTSLPWFPRMR